MTTTTLPAFRMIPADIDTPAGWSPVGFDIHAADGTGAILARIRFGGPTTTGATRDEVLALQAALHAALRASSTLCHACPTCGSPDPRVRYCGSVEHASVHPVNSADRAVGESRCTYCDDRTWHATPA